MRRGRMAGMGFDMPGNLRAFKGTMAPNGRAPSSGDLGCGWRYAQQGPQMFSCDRWREESHSRGEAAPRPRHRLHGLSAA